MLDPVVHADLAAILPASALLTAAEDTRPYECDGLTMFREVPAAVALPENESQVAADSRGAATRRACRWSRAAPAPAFPAARCRIATVCCCRSPSFAAIVAIDPLARTAVVQSGVRNATITEAAAPYGLYYAPDPSSQIACTIGGNVAENSGGVHCLKYGLTVHNVRRVRGVLITGEIVEFGGDALDSPGYDLLALISGSRRHARGDHRDHGQAAAEAAAAQVALAAFDDVEKAGAAVAAVIAAGIVPAGLEMMDQAATRAVEEFVHADYPLDAAAVLLVESDGTPEEVAAEMARDPRVLAAAGATADPRVEGRGAAAALLVGTQGGVSGGRAHLAGLLLHRRHDPAQGARRRCSRASRNCRGSTGCAAPTCFTPATATCTR